MKQLHVSKEFESRFSDLINLNDTERDVFQSVRFRDQDVSVKAGAVLTFSGLVLAACMVQYTAANSTIIFLKSPSLELNVSLIGFLLVTAAAFFLCLAW